MGTDQGAESWGSPAQVPSGPHRKDLPCRGRGCVRLRCSRFLRGRCFGAWRDRNGGRVAQKPVTLEVPTLV